MAEFSGTTQSLCQSLSEKFSENERKWKFQALFLFDFSRYLEAMRLFDGSPIVFP
jgi:hypothetical protein